eukprot:TRINITY_DN9797_c0_g1_i1.p1 TRINITY_DN9797_c0_g1~~TRINITY_DN9797_c0_g1_i1.p1  ORF type:complete len:295 (+),score=71.54 TRINITY_DN9797_c0_g1_i1:1148-2032(+)
MEETVLVVSDDDVSSTTDTSDDAVSSDSDQLDVRSALLSSQAGEESDDGHLVQSLTGSIKEGLKDAILKDPTAPATSTWADMLLAAGHDKAGAKGKAKRKKRKSFCRNKIPPPVLAAGRKGAAAVKIAPKKSGGTRRPCVVATFRRVPPQNEDGVVVSKGGGFARKKVLVDTGATRTAITSDIANSVLKLKAVGSTDVTTGDGVTAKRTLVKICVEVDSTTVHIWATVRPPTALKHCILGIDWVGATCPQWVYDDKRKKRGARKGSTGNLPSVPLSKARKGSVKGRKRVNSSHT